MTRVMPVKTILAFVVAVVFLIAAAVTFQLPVDKRAGVPETLPGTDQHWLDQRLARPAMALPHPGQPEVLLLWRQPLDVSKVRGLLPLVDHPEGLDGVYGADVIEEARDPLFAPLFVSDIMGRLPASGAWIYVQDSTRHRVGLTPVVNPDTISDAFKLAKGMPVQLTGSDNEDPYLHKKAPDFRTQMLNGKFFELDALKGQKIILTFYTNSQESKDISKLIAEAQKRPEFSGVLFYSLLMMSRAEAMKFFKQTGQQSEILLESPAGIAGLYSSRDRPRVFYIGRDENVDYYSMLGDEPALIARNLTKAVGG